MQIHARQLTIAVVQHLKCGEPSDLRWHALQLVPADAVDTVSSIRRHAVLCFLCRRRYLGMAAIAVLVVHSQVYPGFYAAAACTAAAALTRASSAASAAALTRTARAASAAELARASAAAARAPRTVLTTS